MKIAHPLCPWLLGAAFLMTGCGGDSTTSSGTTSSTTGSGGSGMGGAGGQGIGGQGGTAGQGGAGGEGGAACIPEAEVCDGVDNNCDGAVDEDLGTTTCGVGACAVDAPDCLNGQPNACVPNPPTAEVCDGVDNNCDGTVDDGDPEGGQPCDTGMPGVCAAGTSACVNGAVACDQDEQATAETCDGLDNDCNGMADDGAVPGAGQPCDTGMPGACAAGMTACTGGFITCVATTQPAPEVCGNAVDDDCDGAVDEGLEPTGWEVRVTDSATASSPLQVLWTGSEYAVLYHEMLGSSSTPVVHLQRVDASGALIGPPSVLTPTMATSWHGRIAWNGTEYGLVYWTYETWPDDATRFQRVASDGALVGAPVDIDPNPSSQPDIVWNGTDYAVTWMSRVTSQMLFRRISSTGSFITSSAALGSAHSIGELAWTGSEYGVTWDLYDYGASNNTGYFTRVSAAGAEIGSELVVTPTPVPPVGCCGIAGLFDVAWNGSAFGILRRGIADRPTFIPVTSTGVLGASSVVIDEQGMYPEILWSGAEHLATFWWNTRLTFARLSPTGALLGKHTIQGATHPSVGQGRIAWDGASLVAAWKDARHGNDEVSLARYAPACQ